MKLYTRIFVSLCAVLLLGACSAARNGVVNGRLGTNLRPAISIEANAPFALADSGRVWSGILSDSMHPNNNASVDYAVYTDAAASPAQRFAYAAIIRLGNDVDWEFVPQGHRLPGMFGPQKKVEPANREGSLYSLYVRSQGDWASDLLQANDVSVPELWLAKRWVFSLDTGARAMAEYREPWPEDIEIPATEFVLLRESHAAYLDAFERRALAVFSFGSDMTDFSGAVQEKSTWKKPRTAPDVEALVGEVARVTHGNDGTAFE